MLHAYSGFRNFEPGTNFSAWIFRILHNRWCLAAFTHIQVLAAMGALPIGVREALYYTIVVGHTHAEAAAMLDVPLGTVMSRVFRGRKQLGIALAHADVAPAVGLRRHP
jgi:DNA-directed RNA polymerase specialized sigma24 family protein